MRAVSLLSIGGIGAFSLGLSLESVMVDCRNNLDTIYKYTESSVKDAFVSLNGLNVRLTAVAAACGFLLKFAYDVDLNNLRLLASLLLILCVGCCASGLFARAAGNLASPKVLLDEWYYESDEQCRLYILANWSETLKQVDAKRFWKAQCLNWAFVCFVLAFLVLADSVICS